MMECDGEAEIMCLRATINDWLLWKQNFVFIRQEGKYIS